MCKQAFIHVCKYISIYVFIYMHVYVYVYIYACIRVCMNVYMFVSIIMCVSGGLISRNLNYPCYKCMLKPRHNFVVIDTKLLIRYSKTKRRTAAYPRAL